MRHKMVVKRCSKCLLTFRGTKSNDEKMCAKCQVITLPKLTLREGEKVDKEFETYCEETHGSTEWTECTMFGSDVLNHRARLLKLKEECDRLKDAKTRQRRGTEINRILEEHDAVQARLEQLQNEMMIRLMLETGDREGQEHESPSIPPPPLQQVRYEEEERRVSPPSLITLPPVHNRQPTASVPDKDRSPESPKAVAVKGVIINPTATLPPVTENKKQDIIIPTPNLKPKPVAAPRQSLPARLHHVPDFVTLTPDKVQDKIEEDNNNETPEEQEADVLTSLRRSNSVKNRIQAFEAINRRASTGAWDRENNKASNSNSNPRRKLDF